jgi:hypothetical protein
MIFLLLPFAAEAFCIVWESPADSIFFTSEFVDEMPAGTGLASSTVIFEPAAGFWKGVSAGFNTGPAAAVWIGCGCGCGIEAGGGVDRNGAGIFLPGSSESLGDFSGGVFASSRDLSADAAFGNFSLFESDTENEPPPFRVIDQNENLSYIIFRRANTFFQSI